MPDGGGKKAVALHALVSGQTIPEVFRGEWRQVTPVGSAASLLSIAEDSVKLVQKPGPDSVTTKTKLVRVSDDGGALAFPSKVHYVTEGTVKKFQAAEVNLQPRGDRLEVTFETKQIKVGSFIVYGPAAQTFERVANR